MEAGRGQARFLHMQSRQGAGGDVNQIIYILMIYVQQRSEACYF